MLVTMISLLQPSTSSSTNSTAAPWCNGRIDECLINAEAGDEGTDDVLDPIVDFSEISRRVVLYQSNKSPVIQSGNPNRGVCDKPPNTRKKPCIDAIRNGGVPETCSTYKKGCH